MKLNYCFLASVFILASTTLFAAVSIPYGEGSGKADYINNKKYPRIDDPIPSGPSSFRLVEDKIWVADSVGDKLMQFNRNGKLVSELSILPSNMKPYRLDENNLPIMNMFIEDFAPVYGDYGEAKAWWVIEGYSNKLIKFSNKGEKLAEIANPEFAQLYRVEVGKGGHIFLADKMAKAIYTYDAEGHLLNKQNWEWSGMAVAGKKDVLYRLMYDSEAKRNILVASNLKGKVTKSVMLDVAMFNPVLWWVDEQKGECLITFSPDKFEGKYNIVRVGLDGKVRANGEMTMPLVMNRFIDHLDYEDVFIGKGNFYTAPEGKFEIVPFKLP